MDASRHLNILLNAEIFSGPEVADNAKILLKFVRHSEKLASHANSVRLGALASAREPVMSQAIQSATLGGKASYTAFGGEAWATSYDPTLPTSC